jgi:hypothetical protein
VNKRGYGVVAQVVRDEAGIVGENERGKKGKRQWIGGREEA